MNSNVVIPTVALADLRSWVELWEGRFDTVAKVSLVEGTFDPKDATTWPSASAAFNPIDAADAWQDEYDAVSDQHYIVAPDPEEGWDFVSLSGGVSITGFIVRSTALTPHPICANVFAEPINITASGQHINLPWIAVDAQTMLTDGETPYALP